MYSRRVKLTKFYKIKHDWLAVVTAAARSMPLVGAVDNASGQNMITSSSEASVSHNATTGGQIGTYPSTMKLWRGLLCSTMVRQLLLLAYRPLCSVCLERCDAGAAIGKSVPHRRCCRLAHIHRDDLHAARSAEPLLTPPSASSLRCSTEASLGRLDAPTELCLQCLGSQIP